MSDLSDAAKRLLLGRPVRSDRLGHTLIPKRIALPVFASDALSSVAYAPDEILLTLSLAGASALVISPWVGLAVVFVMLVVVASYRQNVHAYPSGGGDYEVATTNLGPNAGVTVASALLVDYVLTVAVSISSGAQYAATAFPPLRGHEAAFAVGLVVLLTVANLRGVKESGTPVRRPGVPVHVRDRVGRGRRCHPVSRPATCAMAESADLQLLPQRRASTRASPGSPASSSILRAFASGCAALTGVEAISNGVPAFKKPKSKNAATTLALLGGISVTMIMSILLLARATRRDVRRRPDDPADPQRPAGRGHLHPAPGDQPALDRGVPGHPVDGGHRLDRHRASSSCSPPTPRSTASPCSARSSPATGSCRASCTPAATGSRSPTASSRWPSPRSR